MNNAKFTFTSESVTEGHPDKVADQISDSILDEILKYDVINGMVPYRTHKEDRRGSRVACETYVSTGLVLVGGEITTESYVDIKSIVRDTIQKIGYTDPALGFESNTVCILNAINEQSPDIAMGVDTGGAGDQGLMIGYACDETPEMLPLPIALAHRLSMRLAEVRKKGILSFLRPDGKSQVTVEYENGRPVTIPALVIAAQHDESVVKDGTLGPEARELIIENVIKPVIPPEYLTEKTMYHINPTGRFVVGGPHSDTGMTGRKIIVDTYGGYASHGGGAFSGKDPTKVDRSAGYAVRYVAKNIVAAGLASRCTVHISYAIGVKKPLNIMVNTHGTGVIPDTELSRIVSDESVFQLDPMGIIQMLDLWKPIYRNTAAYGHFGRNTFSWEKTDKISVLHDIAGKAGK